MSAGHRRASEAVATLDEDLWDVQLARSGHYKVRCRECGRLAGTLASTGSPSSSGWARITTRRHARRCTARKDHP